MSELAIRVESLGKQYRIARRPHHDTIREALAFAVSESARRIRSLAHRRGGTDGETFWALRDVNFEVRQGEAVAIIGRNGAGKSTLLKILSRITEPTTGQADIRGRAGSLLEVGGAFHPELSGRDNIYVNGVLLGLHKTEIDRRFDEIVAFAEVESFIDVPIKRYSTGMHMRLAFAIAAHLETDILFVDELLAVGDAMFRKKCLRKMDGISRQGRTVLFVSHNMAAVRTLCNRALWLRQGELIRQGAVENVVAEYLANGEQNCCERVWNPPETAPGGAAARIRAVHLLNQRREPCGEFNIGEPLTVETEYDVLGRGAAINVSISVFANEACVFASPSTSGRCPTPPVNESGTYRSRCEIPANLFNEGRFDVNVLLVGNAQDVIAQVDRAVSFEMRDPGQLRGGYLGPWGGVVRPEVVWNTTQITRDNGSQVCPLLHGM